MKSSATNVSGWGRYLAAPVTVLHPQSSHELATGSLPGERVIARGLGRSYGDAAQLRNGSVVETVDCTRSDWVDRAAGVIRVDAGVSIGHLIDRYAPKGWFVPVTPGTRQVTVGGAIAADIHGKNHHIDGSFGDHVVSMRIRLANDDVLNLSPFEKPEIFWATVGGMGLTGIVIDAVVRLKKIPTTTVAVETQRFRTLDELMSEMRASDQRHAFSVAWVDLLGSGRSVLTQGSFATVEHQQMLEQLLHASGAHRKPPAPSVSLPPVPLPRLATIPTIKAFNELWFRKAPADLTVTAESITAFFHPLDAIVDWNRVYGSTGFVQWQCVIPDSTLFDTGPTGTAAAAKASDDVLRDLVERFGHLPSFFSVLKRFGPANGAPLSFPISGWTLTVDLPATRKTLDRLGAFDRIVADAGGRIYLAKDARLDRNVFESMYPRLDEFRRIRNRLDPHRRFASDLSERLGI